MQEGWASWLGELSAPWRKANDSVANADNESARGVHFSHFSHVGTAVCYDRFIDVFLCNLPWGCSILQERSKVAFSHHQEESARRISRSPFFVDSQRQRRKNFVARKISVAQGNGSGRVLFPWLREHSSGPPSNSLGSSMASSLQRITMNRFISRSIVSHQLWTPGIFFHSLRFQENNEGEARGTKLPSELILDGRLFTFWARCTISDCNDRLWL